MRKSVSLLLGFACVAYVTGCGNNTTSTTTVYDSLPIPSAIAASAPNTQLGGAIQGKELVFKNPTSIASFAGGTQGLINATGTSAAFYRPFALTSDGVNLYVADYFNNVIRQINILTNEVTLLAGNSSGIAGSADGSGTAATFNRPNGITYTTVGGSKYLFVTDSGNFTIRKIDLSNNNVTTIAGTVGSAGSVDADIGTNARFNVLNGITTTDGSILFVTDSNNTVRSIHSPTSVPSGAVRTVAGTPGTIATLGSQNNGIQAAARFNQPAGITTDGPNLYVCDFGDSTIRKISLADGSVTTIAGVFQPGGATGSSTDGFGLAATFNQPHGITTDGKNLYVTDSFDNTVRKIILSSGEVKTILNSTAGGTATFGTPSIDTIIGITTDGTSLYLTNFTQDITNHSILQIQ